MQMWDCAITYRFARRQYKPITDHTDDARVAPFAHVAIVFKSLSWLARIFIVAIVYCRRSSDRVGLINTIIYSNTLI